MSRILRRSARASSPGQPGRLAGLVSGPLAEVQLATLVLTLGTGAWFTCWAVFFTRSVGLSATSFGAGVTAAGVVSLVLGSPLGYLADRLGTREVLVCLGMVQGLATLGYLLVSEFWGFMAVSLVAVTAQRIAPGIRVALVAGLTTGGDRLQAISTNRVIQHVGLTVGSALGALVLVLDRRAAYLALVVLYAVLNLAAAMLTLRVERVPPVPRTPGGPGMRVLRDRPFLLITSLSGVLALNWGCWTPACRCGSPPIPRRRCGPSGYWSRATRWRSSRSRTGSAGRPTRSPGLPDWAPSAVWHWPSPACCSL